MKIETLSHALHLMFLHLLHGPINPILEVFSSYRHLMLTLRLSGAIPPFPHIPSCYERAQLYQHCITATFRHKLTATEGVQRTSEMEDPFCVENWRVSQEL